MWGWLIVIWGFSNMCCEYWFIVSIILYILLFYMVNRDLILFRNNYIYIYVKLKFWNNCMFFGMFRNGCKFFFVFFFYMRNFYLYFLYVYKRIFCKGVWIFFLNDFKIN